VYIDLPEKKDEYAVEASAVCLSECYADIYQDLKNFVERYKIGENESMHVAVAFCRNDFFARWGMRTIGIMQELHLLLSSGEQLDDDEGSTAYNNYENEF